MRTSIALLALMAVIGYAAPSSARDIKLRQYTADDIKSACEKAGGSLSQDASGYGCGTDCHGKPGTDCVVFCKNGEACYAQVIGARRPKDVLGALRTPAGRP